MFCWPVTKYKLGLTNTYTWNMSQTIVGTSLIGNILLVVIFFLAIDLYTYFKHSALHTKYLWAFHKVHHSNQNPSPFASYSTSPVEAFLTFIPACKFYLINKKSMGFEPNFKFILGVCTSIIVSFYDHGDSKCLPSLRIYDRHHRKNFTNILY